MRNWVLGSMTTAMAVGGLFVAAHAVYGAAYYGGLLYFAFAVVFIFLLIKTGYDEAGEITALNEFRAFFARAASLVRPDTADARSGEIVVHTIDTADLKDAFFKGFADFNMPPTHLIVLCVVYPIVGLFLGRLTAGYEVLPILFGRRLDQARSR